MHSQRRKRRAVTIWVGIALFVLSMAPPTSAFNESKSASLPAISSETAALLTEYLEEQFAASGRPGLAAAVVQGDEVVLTLSLGESRQGVPMTPETPVLLASVSKSITAMTLASLVDDGLVALDDPLTRHLPELGPAAKEVTVADLMYQHSGISVVSGNELWTNTDATLESNLENVSGQLDPAAGFEYSNANYDLLALVVERAAGESFSDTVVERLFRPLGMDDSYVGPPEAGAELAQGHYRWIGLGYRPIDDLASPGMVGSAVMYSSAKDLANLLIAQLNDGQFGDSRVVSSEAVGLLHRARPYEEEPFSDYPVQPGYAGGLAIDASFVPGEVDDELSSLTTLYHVGSSISSNSAIWMVPEAELGFVILVNGYAVADDHWIGQVAQGAKAVLFGLEPHEVVSGLPFLTRWGIPLLAFLFLLQVGLAGGTVPALRRRRAGEHLRPRDFALITVVTLVDLLAITAIFWLIPTVSEQPLRVSLAAPDLRLIVLGLGAGVLWGFVRNIFLLSGSARSLVPGP